MIKFSKIDDQLSIYQKKDVIIYGAGISGKTIYQLLLSRGVEARLFCDSDKEKWGGLSVRQNNHIAGTNDRESPGGECDRPDWQPIC